MKTANALLNDLKAMRGLTSEYQLAKALGMSQSKVRNYRKGRSLPGDAECIKLAEALGVGPAYVIAVVHLERERNPYVRKVWLSIARMTNRP